MNWKEINKMLVYLRKLGYELEHMSIPDIKKLYEEVIMGGLDYE